MVIGSTPPAEDWMMHGIEADTSDSDSSPGASPLVGQSSSDDKYTLIPIDHGYILTTLSITWWDWTWLSWKQLREPVAPALASWIANIDPAVEERILESALGGILPKKASWMLRITTRFLQLTIAAGLTLKAIAQLVSREEDDKPSQLEIMVAHAADMTQSDPRSQLKPLPEGQTKMERMASQDEKDIKGSTTKGVGLHRSWSDSQVNLRSMAGGKLHDLNIKKQTSLPSTLEIPENGPSHELQREDSPLESPPADAPEDLMTVLSKRVGAERIPEVFWEYFAVAVQRTIAKVAKDDD